MESPTEMEKERDIFRKLVKQAYPHMKTRRARAVDFQKIENLEKWLQTAWETLKE